MAKRKDEELMSPEHETTEPELRIDEEPTAVLPMNYEAAWAALKDFAMRHLETRKGSGKTFGEMIQEFVYKIENGYPV